MESESGPSLPVARRVVAWSIDIALLVFITIKLEQYFLRVVRISETETYILIGIVSAGYFLFKDAVRGMSIGKFVTRLNVVDDKTNLPIGPFQSAKRNAIVVGLLVLAVGLAQASRYIVGDDIAANIGAGLILGAFIGAYAGFRSGDGRTTSDRFARTKVVRITRNA